jgi:hypothetical protein
MIEPGSGARDLRPGDPIAINPFIYYSTLCNACQNITGLSRTLPEPAYMCFHQPDLRTLKYSAADGFHFARSHGLVFANHNRVPNHQFGTNRVECFRTLNMPGVEAQYLGGDLVDHPRISQWFHTMTRIAIDDCDGFTLKAN